MGIQGATGAALIKRGTVGSEYGSDLLLIVCKIENNILYCHRYKDKKIIKIPLDQFHVLFY